MPDIYCDECGNSESSCRCSGIYRPKRPTSRVPHIGVEIEFLCDLGSRAVATRFEAAGLADVVYLRGDGSISGRGTGHEINVLCKEATYKRTIRKVCRTLREMSAIVNRSCGLHVHLDMRHRNKERVFSNLVGMQGVLLKMQPESRRRNSYCMPQAHRDYAQARRSGSRAAINPFAFERHRTIEIRLHTGTTNYKKITNWIAILLKIAGKRTIVEATDQVPEFARVLRLPRALRTYVDQRVTLFSPRSPEETGEDAAA